MNDIKRLDPKKNQVTWEVWYQDAFDRECPRQVEVRGTGLANGLMELWARHLFETVRPDGGKGISHYNLWLKEDRRSIEIRGNRIGQNRLRRWIYGDLIKSYRKYTTLGNVPMLKSLAEAHAIMVRAGETSQMIIEKAADVRSEYKFVDFLMLMLRSDTTK